MKLMLSNWSAVRLHQQPTGRRNISPMCQQKIVYEVLGHPVDEPTKLALLLPIELRRYLSSQVRSETEELLDSILPPREWEEEGQLWRQSVSSTPATRLDVINLQVKSKKNTENHLTYCERDARNSRGNVCNHDIKI